MLFVYYRYHGCVSQIIMELAQILRPLQPADSPQLQQLFSESPDSGKISIAAQYQIDPYTALTAHHTNMTGVVVERPENGKIIGLGLVRVGECHFGGSWRPYALLSHLVVHPQYRGQGIATQLAQWRIEYAQTTLGEDVVILAAIQTGNTASTAVAAKWSRQIVGHYRSCLLPVRTKPVKQDKYIIRIVQENELQIVADGLNTFYQPANLSVCHNAASLADWLVQTPLTRPFRHYYVATDEQGHILAGLAVTEQCQLVAMQVASMPGWMRGVNKIVHMVPADGMMRQLAVSKFWFQSGQEAAARVLWEHVSFACRHMGSHLTLSFDPQGPIAHVLKLPFWLPKGHFSVYANQEVTPLEDRWLAPL